MNGQMMTWVAIGILLAAGLLVASNKLRKVASFAARGAIGALVVVFINFALGGFGLAVGINIITLAVMAFLGLPGVVMLYGLSFFI